MILLAWQVQSLLVSRKGVRRGKWGEGEGGGEGKVGGGEGRVKKWSGSFCSRPPCSLLCA